MNGVDTNVLVYSVDADAGPKRERALELLASLEPGDTLLPWQVVCETAAVLTRIADTRQPDADPLAFIRAITTRYRVVMPSEQVVTRGLDLRRRHQMSFWDALLFAACAEGGIDRLYSEDMQGKPAIEGVVVVNPFA